ncbi:pyruvate phosphate dikinase PEP/pyruvate-binding [Pseudarthrobacter chlorophenolicus A6]|uniref:Pyruvate phosphate dikinase PEP/pyruvate-binding n=1 Tax=Pseudarthrobacter chlorophenolicus (strain ATCC 700700 / DSM 12829 / CIP 107037 / JCM 12360 / KCTC 9906 / NCIMB 13794 / A6) TaxID=452863 RepID=B8HBB9_PSECP|nr:PEP/pyruvate-binding domain-containing protein [Pseudarthrobacter chlorophenolicus]ACL38604.1 pyruvate phosphate dikinase PEP/pyruvate-binding [Pseudarthrobacter chlorophenolicus A6]SDQ45504.1 pyruvate, water dikinase [Pseudarthrobacter chlorophenolicus]
MQHPESSQGGRPAAAPGADLVVDLRRLGAGMLAQVGGKAANLGELLAAGLPVPEGFCLTTEAYRLVTGAPDSINPELAAVHAALRTPPGGPGQPVAAAPETATHRIPAPANSPPDIPALAAMARAAVVSAPLPPEVAAAVERAYGELGADVPVAVRSSATAEDLPFASFAGQQDTYLNVVGAAAVLEAVRNCWVSLWTDRATTYRASLGIDPAEVALAVVVQRMVDVETAGVLFTANPVTGRRNEAVIDASPGLGEAVVSGAVNPDHFVVDPAAGRVVERRQGDKRIAVLAVPGGGTRTVDAAEHAGFCLTDRQAADLARLGLKAEQHFGAPQDLEWAISRGGSLWLTQSRPITTLYPVPRRRDGAAGTRGFLCFSLAQGLTRPITPMGRAAIRQIASSVARTVKIPVADPRVGPPAYADAGQRIFIDFTTPIRSTVGRAILPRVFDVMEARSATVMRRLFDDPSFAVTLRTPLPLLRRILPAAVRAGLPEAILRGIFRPQAALRRLDRFTRDFEAALELDPGAAGQASARPTARDRLAHAEGLLQRRLFTIVPAILPLAALGFGMLGVAGKLLGGNRWEDLQGVLRGLPNNVTTDMDLELWHLAAALRDDPGSRAFLAGKDTAALAAAHREGGLPPRLEAGLSRFLDRYGHRAVAEIDVGMPRWSDDPAHILGVLANYLRLEDPDLAPDVQFSNAADAAEAQVERLAAEARTRGRIRGALVRAALHRARLFAGLRELPKYHLVLGLAEVRRQLQHVGADLEAAGTLDRAEDIFFLDFAEVSAALDTAAGGGAGTGPAGGPGLRALVVERRADYDRELGRRHIPRVLLSDGTEPEAAQAAAGGITEGTLTGSPASAGTVTGVARVILDPVGAHLEPGEILVAPSTDPGWTPLFLTAGGLVMEMGGANSHGAVVAREYGIPAVVGVPDATGRISSGQEITVDGGAGTIVPS